MNFAQHLVRWRWLWTTFTLLSMLLLAYGAKNLTFQSDYKIFFSKDNPQLAAYQDIEETFTHTDGIAFLISHADMTVLQKPLLEIQEKITADAWQMPFSRRVDSLVNYQHTEVSGDELNTRALVENAAALNPAQLRDIQSIALNSEEILHWLISPDEKIAVVSVSLNFPENAAEKQQAAKTIMASANAIVQKYESQLPGLKVQLMGVAAYNGTFVALTEQDATTLVPAMYAVIALLLLALLRSISAMLSTLLLITISIISAVGFMGWLGWPLNQVNISAPTIIMTLAVCDAVHLYNRFLFYLREGSDKYAAMQHALRNNIRPIILTSVTTAIGFLSMNFSDSPPFRELGTITAFGVAVACVYTFTLLPTLMLILPGNFKGSQSRLHPLALAAGEVAIKHKRKIIWGAAPLSLLFAGFMLLNDLNDDAIGYFSKNVPFRQAAEYMEKHLPGFDTIAYMVDSGAADGINDPAFLQKTEEFVQWLKAQPEITYVGSYTSTLKRLNKNMHDGAEDAYRLPESAELASQYGLMYELSLPYGLDLTNQVSSDKSKLRVYVKIRDQTSSGLIAIEERSKTWIEKNMQPYRVKGSSVPVMFAHFGLSNIKNMLWGSLFAILFVSLTIAITMGSLRYGLLSMIPNAFPAAIAFGLWGIFVGEVNVAVSVIFAITLGIIVDDTVHFMSKYQDAREMGKDPEAAVRYGFSSVGSALIVTTLVLGCGFMVLALSDFNVSAYTGIMVCLTIVIALAFDFFLLPAILLLTDKPAETLPLENTEQRPAEQQVHLHISPPVIKQA